MKKDGFGMKLDAEVLTEIRKTSVGCLICTALVMLGFLLAGMFDLSVLFGSLIGLALSVGNFYFMSVGVTAALETGDETAAKLKLRQSYVIRTAVMLGIMVLSFVVDEIHWLPVVASAFYVRVIIAARNIYGTLAMRRDMKLHPEKYENDDTPSSDTAACDDEDEDEEDGFEKFVGSFAKGPVPGKNLKEKSADDASKASKDSK